jgi:uncharacterized membrane protein YccF (DUF307 family)
MSVFQGHTKNDNKLIFGFSNTLGWWLRIVNKNDIVTMELSTSWGGMTNESLVDYLNTLLKSDSLYQLEKHIDCIRNNTDPERVLNIDA